jgi:hypothetical protein
LCFCVEEEGLYGLKPMILTEKQKEPSLLFSKPMILTEKQKEPSLLFSRKQEEERNRCRDSLR